MPISALDPHALARLTPGELASLALSADQEARRAKAAGRDADALEHAAERDRLCVLYQDREVTSA